MGKHNSDKFTCFICDYWGLLLLLIVIIIATIATYQYWEPILRNSVLPSSLEEPIQDTSVPNELSANNSGGQNSTIPTGLINNEAFIAPPQETNTPEIAVSTLTQLPIREIGSNVGFFAPDFRMISLEGEEQKLHDLIGKPVLLFFFSPGCGYCTQEAEAIGQLAQEYSQNELLIIPVDTSNSGNQVLQQYSIEYGWDINIFKDLYNEGGTAFRVVGTPAHYFVDKTGKIISILPGGPRSLEELKQAVELIL